jgi:hypothetical protein
MARRASHNGTDGNIQAGGQTLKRLMRAATL